MPAFAYRRFQSLLGAVERYRFLLQGANRFTDFTRESVIDALVRPDHRAAIDATVALIPDLIQSSAATTAVMLPDPDPAASGSSASRSWVYVTFSFPENAFSYPLPAYTCNGFREGADPAFVEAVQKYAARWFVTSREFSVGIALLRHANDVCKSPAQLRYILPCIQTLLADIHEDWARDLRAELSEARVPGTVPALHPEMRETTRRFTKILARAALLSDDFTIPTKSAYVTPGNLKVPLPWAPDQKIALT